MNLLSVAGRWVSRLLAALMICGLTVSGCAHNCVTYCGFTADELPDDWTCEDVQAVETAVVRELGRTKDVRFGRVCDLRGYKLKVIDAPTWMSFKSQVSGLTYCENGNVIIGNQPPADNALAHEFAHALQRCTPLGPFEEDFYHSNWRRDGIYDAINRATESLDAGD